MRLTQKQLDKTLKQLDHIVKVYKKKYSKDDKRDWRTYEQRLAVRMKTAAKELESVVEEAYSMIEIKKREKKGRKLKLQPTKMVLLLLLKEIFQLSNRRMSNMLMFFTAFTHIDVSYKTVERVYSNELGSMIIHNMFIILTKRKGIRQIDASGDGTGYSLTVTKHYRNERESGHKHEKNVFAYAFALMDLDTGIYVGYGTSMRSEQEAFEEAVVMSKNAGIEINSVRLDKLYSYQSIADKFNVGTKIYIIPKKNATIRGPPEWKEIIKNFIKDTFSYLRAYYKRNNSESGFSVDKGMCGWKIWQKRDDRIKMAMMCNSVWHNLMLIG